MMSQNISQTKDFLIIHLRKKQLMIRNNQLTTQSLNINSYLLFLFHFQVRRMIQKLFDKVIEIEQTEINPSNHNPALVPYCVIILPCLIKKQPFSTPKKTHWVFVKVQ